MMRFEQYYSSSKGNLYTVTSSNGRRLLLECGVRWNLIQTALDFKLNNIDGCLVTHDHLDHCKALANVMAAGIDVYSSSGTFEKLGALGSHRAKPVKADKVFYLSDTFSVMPFAVHHDAAEPFGYVIYDRVDRKYLYWSMDSSHIESDLYIPDKHTGRRKRIPFDTVAIELSYETERLQWQLDTGNINVALAKRLLTSHTEKQTAIDYIAKFINLYQCREIHLLHTSSSRLNRPQAKRDFEKKFFVKTFIKGIK